MAGYDLPYSPRQTTCVHWLHVALVYFAYWENSEDTELDTEQQLEKMLLWIYVCYGVQKPLHAENMICFPEKKAKQHCFHLMIWSRQVDCPVVSTDSHTSGAGYSILNPTMSVMFEMFLCLLESSAPSRKMDYYFLFLLQTFFLFNFAN